MHDLARDNLAKTTVTEGGLFLPLVGRAQAACRAHVGAKYHLETTPYVNQHRYHILDRDWAIAIKSGCIRRFPRG
jgi:hypothetical protein